MTTDSLGSRIDGRPANPTQEVVDDRRMTPGAASRVPSSLVRIDGWKPAHTEAARFVGECFAVGAVLGFVTELARPVWEKRHG